MHKTIIERKRKKLGFTQKELAKKLGVDIRQVRRWEKKEQAPKTKKLYKICKVLGIEKYDMHKLVYDYKEKE